MSLIQQSHTQPATASRWLVLALAAMAAGLFTLDTSLNVIALPAIARSFGTSTAEVVWVTIGSQLVLLGLSLPIGSLADALGRRRLFTLGFGVFLIGLAGSYLSPALPVLVGARIVQGLGLALFISTRNAIAVEGFPPRAPGHGHGRHHRRCGHRVRHRPAAGRLPCWRHGAGVSSISPSCR